MDTPAKRKGSRKTVTAPNIEALGAERLAEVLIDLAGQLPAIKRRLRLELAARVGPEDLAAEVGKRLASYETRKSRVHWRRYRDVVRELDLQRAMISGPLAEAKPAAALDMLWRFLALAPHLFRLADDSRGELIALFHTAVADLAAIAKRALPAPAPMVEQVITALLADRDNVTTPLVEALIPALGAEGVRMLRIRLEAASNTAPRARPGLRDALRVLADAEGDVDAYIATFPAADRTQPSVGAPIARRLLRAGRIVEAIKALEQSAPPISTGYSTQPPTASALAWEDAWLEAMEADGQPAKAQAMRWQAFERRLDTAHLRAFLSRQPDFEDIEWEDRAMAYARTYPNAQRALEFYLGWPALKQAADLIAARGREIDGGAIALLDEGARALETRWPLAATALRRAMIGDVLRFGRREYYPDLERWLDECASQAAEIGDWGGLEPHEDFARRVAGIRRR